MPGMQLKGLMSVDGCATHAICSGNDMQMYEDAGIFTHISQSECYHQHQIESDTYTIPSRTATINVACRPDDALYTLALQVNRLKINLFPSFCTCLCTKEL
jgi:hypothetical protein